MITMDEDYVRDKQAVAHTPEMPQTPRIDGRKLICTVGLPLSGKTRWARRQGLPIVCPDAIRLALHGQRYQAEAEPFVWAVARVMVRALFSAGHVRVILDACNNTRKRREEWSREFPTAFKVIDTPAELCLERALELGDQYVIPIIGRMAGEHEPVDQSEENLWHS